MPTSTYTVWRYDRPAYTANLASRHNESANAYNDEVDLHIGIR